MAQVKHRVGIEGAFNAVFDCLTTTAGLEGWWATSASGVAEAGSSVELEFAGLATLRFIFDELGAGIVSLTCASGPGPWQGSKLLFELEQSEDQVFVTLTHRNDRASEDDFLYFSTKWPVYLLSLKSLVETGRGKPYPDDIKIHVGD